jgi:D-sedoheptulose 7-phosphate isomerase
MPERMDRAGTEADADMKPVSLTSDYPLRLSRALVEADWTRTETLVSALYAAWKDGRQVFLCGNGGSAANALHIANDLLYGVTMGRAPGLRVHALPANVSALTCLANDLSYDDAFAPQLRAYAQPGDLLIVLSGSGNSANILKALAEAETLGLRTAAILGFSGGKAKGMADIPVHFAVDDMQISEDLQLVVGHYCMQALLARFEADHPSRSPAGPNQESIIESP